MYNSIRGKITGFSKENIYIDNHGIEYEISVSSYSFLKFNEIKDQDVRVFIYLQHKEDMMKLFGFHSEDERKLFLKLIKVEGLGPKQSLKVLSGMPYKQFITALENEDLKALMSIPGLGKKTSQKIVLQLKGTLISEDHSSDSNIVENELVQALADMGFDKKQAKKVLENLFKESPDYDEQEIFKEAIIRLTGGMN